MENIDHFDNLSETSFNDHNSSSDEDIEKIGHNFDTHYANTHTNKLEILLTYVKGQKHLYAFCSQLSKHKLNFLMVPTILISTVNTISSPFILNYSWGNNISSALNSIILLLISMISYFKYESHSQSFMHLSNQYDKIETSLKLIGNNMHSYIENNEYNDKINFHENKIGEIKDGLKMLIPKEARTLYPIIYQVNIFTLLRKMDHHKNLLLYKFKNIREQLKQVLLNKNEEKGNEPNYISNLYQEKEYIKNEIQKTNEICSNIDDIFSREIRNADQTSLYCCIFQQQKKISFHGVHPLVEKYFTFVFAED